jgi:hypothetical protein
MIVVDYMFRNKRKKERLEERLSTPKKRNSFTV